MKKVKRLIYIGFIFLLALLIVNISQISLAAEDSSIKVIIKGKNLYMDSAPVIKAKEGRTYMHVRDFAKALDFKVEWLGEENTVKLWDSDTTILIPIEERTISINNKKINLDQKNFVEKGKTFIPLRSLAEALSEKVQWDQKNEIVIVGKFTAKEYLEDTFLYTNEEYKYTMNFPNSWKEEAVLETKDGILRTYDKASYDKFKEKGFKNFGAAFEIRVEESPIFLTVPYEDVLLDYKDGKYIETYFGEDFQYFPDTVESYKKIYEEAKQSLGSFKALDVNDPPIESGKTESFTYDGLKLEVTNVGDIRVETMIDDGGNPWEYKVFVCHPGASVRVLDAGMNDGKFAEDRKPYANWGIELSSGKDIKIVDNMKPFEVTTDTIGIYNLEASLYVLKFEIAK
ncbi:MAG TPA: copper amine oxidase N-terminal domain-containing protein [Tissierellaceae bacterium]|nr:copper amine oxidase N-terminal domain-containing protein [Tissierellaceae bacterium]